MILMSILRICSILFQVVQFGTVSLAMALNHCGWQFVITFALIWGTSVNCKCIIITNYFYKQYGVFLDQF